VCDGQHVLSQHVCLGVDNALRLVGSSAVAASVDFIVSVGTVLLLLADCKVDIC
jgi:hypothetical protein